VPGGEIRSLCDPISYDQLKPHSDWIDRVASLYMQHRFDLLGSGWTEVGHGHKCKGVDGVLYPPHPIVDVDSDGYWLAGRLNSANVDYARRIWRLVDADYVPVDWQLDFKSGFRWSESRWHGDVSFGHFDGVDIKVPWELARMQHLVVLAWAHGLTNSTSSPFVREFRNQILDFIATNPPRFGVNWVCAMDVAIRVANWVVAFGLFEAAGVRFDYAFMSAVKNSFVDHGRHIVSHLEINADGRGNHYLADICGLSFVAAALPSCPETDGWLGFAIGELAGELRYQFNSDGTNFEGSTTYHRLSTETVAYATALVAGLPQDRIDVLNAGHFDRVASHPYRGSNDAIEWPGFEHAERLQKAAAFLSDVTKADGHMVQIGDNDSGHFLKPHPVYATCEEQPEEDRLTSRGTIALVEALTGGRSQTAAVEACLEGALARSLMRGRVLSHRQGFTRPETKTANGILAFWATVGDSQRTVEIMVPGGGLCRDLALSGYADFGLWIFRSSRLYLSVRCGRSHGIGVSGSHAHNDQLSFELAIDGEDWLSDPGSYLYCPPAPRRDAWRSVRAHTAPQWPGREPGLLNRGGFQLIDKAHARCLYFGLDGFVGEHHGFGPRVSRLILLADNTITICDMGLSYMTQASHVKCGDRDAVREAFPTIVPFSQGYGHKRADVPAGI
jgi:hypothetical protein